MERPSESGSSAREPGSPAPGPPAEEPWQFDDPVLRGLRGPRPQAQSGNDGTGTGGGLASALRDVTRYAPQQLFDNPQGGGQFGEALQFDTKGVEFGPWVRRFLAWLRDMVAPLVRRAPVSRELLATDHAALRAARLEAERRYAFRLQGRRIGCLLVHGLTSTPQSVRVLGEYLAEHGIDVEAVLLPGHGTTPEDLETTCWEDWYEAVRAGLDRLRPRCDHLFVCGSRWGEALCPVSTLISGMGLNITFMSYAGQVVIGYTANAAALPGADRLARYTREAFATLERQTHRPGK